MTDPLRSLKQDLDKRLKDPSKDVISPCRWQSWCPALIPGQGMRYTTVIVLFHMSSTWYFAAGLPAEKALICHGVDTCLILNVVWNWISTNMINLKCNVFIEHSSHPLCYQNALHHKCVFIHTLVAENWEIQPAGYVHTLKTQLQDRLESFSKRLNKANCPWAKP